MTAAAIIEIVEPTGKIFELPKRARKVVPGTNALFSSLLLTVVRLRSCGADLTLIPNDDMDFAGIRCRGPIGLARRKYLSSQTVVRFEQYW
jgi:hypothetical protein